MPPHTELIGRGDAEGWLDSGKQFRMEVVIRAVVG
jgi:hypothetical protein